jgi:predicted nucleic acid-binding Zn ribbon protein
MARRNRAPTSREKDPTPLSDALRELRVERGWDTALALGRLRAKWAEVVGDHVAVRSEPIKLEKGRLTVRVEGGAWAAELALLGHELATRAARFLGRDLVQEVAVVTGSPRKDQRRSIGPI